MTLVAMSVQGEASRGALVPPDLTHRALEETGVAFNELLMPIDDLSQISNQKDVRTVARFLAYHFCDGGGRAISDTIMKRGDLPFERYRSVGLISYEESSAAIATLAGVKRRAGETVRFFDLLVDSPSGVFDRIPGTETRPRDEIVKALEGALGQSFGTALPAFLRWLHNKGDAWCQDRLKQLIAEFVERASAEGDNVTRRAAQKFGLIYATLVLAKKAGIVPWPKKTIRRVIRRTFGRAMSAASLADDKPVTNEELVRRLRDALEEPGSVVNLVKGRELPNDNNSWLLVRGIRSRKGELVGLKLERLASVFPRREDRARLLDELASRGVVPRLQNYGSYQPRLTLAGKTVKLRVVPLLKPI